MKYNFKNGGKFDMYNVEIHFKGDLKGYITGMLQTSLADSEHEFLYRIKDRENGNDFTMVSIDYSYMIPLKEDHFDYIERALYNDYLINNIKIKELLK